MDYLDSRRDAVPSSINLLGILTLYSDFPSTHMVKYTLRQLSTPAASQANIMRLAVLPWCAVLVTVALALVRQNHYTRLEPNAAPHFQCEINSIAPVPAKIVARPFLLLMYCGSWCNATPNCNSFCVTDVQSTCALFSSIIGREYSGSTSTMTPDIVCYSSAASVFNIIGRDTVIFTTAASIYSTSLMTDHVYHPCQAPNGQTYYTQFTDYPSIRFDFGRGEIVEAIYLMAETFSLTEIRLGNSTVNSDNPLISFVESVPKPIQEFRVPLTQLYKGRYLSFNCLDFSSTSGFFGIGEVRVLRPYG
ncbi:hypothetical protein FHG87_020988 [Trinorchestia longiramus]|nr:hypothetical protein FHG87_020988 [Trinorchestia longiramus]